MTKNDQNGQKYKKNKINHREKVNKVVFNVGKEKAESKHDACP